VYINPRDLEEFKRIVRKLLSIDLSSYKDNFLRRRLAMRMRAVGARNLKEYINLILSDPTELNRLLDNITINVSQFFRDPHIWVAIYEQVLSPLIKLKRKRNSYTIRIWSAGCARGEEPYSISIMLHELLGAEINRFNIVIYATDIDPKAIAAAKEGRYHVQSVMNVPTSWLKRHFAYDAATGMYSVKPHIKRIVRFMIHDLTRDPPPRSLDIIFCRYVMIYFDKVVQKLVLQKFLHALNSGGYLILGPSEYLLDEFNEYFEPIDIRARIYKKKGLSDR